MQTYQYRFPASGQLKDENAVKECTEELYGLLDSSPDCLMTYCIFPSDSAILDHVTLETDSDRNLQAVNLHTYTELWDGCENDLKDCVSANMEALGGNLSVTGDVKDLGLTGEAPETLYRIVERRDLEQILTQGMIPGNGANAYKDYEDHVYLCEAKDIAPWLAVLKQMDEPALVAVDTKDVSGLEPGRMFKDRYFVPEGYSEYRTKDPIPASAIKEINPSLSDDLGQQIVRDLVNQVNHTEDPAEMHETETGLYRSVSMGMVSESYAENVIEAHWNTLERTPEAETDVEEGLPWAVEDEGLPWAVDDDDFTKAVMAISEPTMEQEK